MADPSVLEADLVLEGGGVLGIGHVGAISVLEEAGYSFPRVAGTSAGSIVGALVAAGMRSSRITDIMATLDYRQFADRSLLDRVPIGGPLLSLLMDDGVFEGDRVREWLGNLLVDECGVETFADLALDDPGSSLPPERRFRLVVTATDVTRGELVHFPWDYEGTYGLEPGRQRVADAVRASMSIPFFYEPVTLTGADGATSTLVDGGVLSNFPIDIFDRTDGRPPRWPTFGVKLLPLLPVDAAKLVPIAGLFQHGPVALAADLAMTAIVGRDQAHLAKPWVKVRTMRVDSAGVNPIDFGLSRAQATALFENGRAAATRFLREWDWADYLATFRGVGRPTT
ncbi:patatin-like phospholipase family protein [Nocardioides mesophilus]|uniref:Patatin-like phospholipase family protein n=1 Tax=Nocardioides mesophilus TaxID=433659 RepID=A0A7G9RA55_9ACTN|nr:patatin-like phospholipase family protein [Nocardioides mesophilus]QNN52480.1 patatin-like phospholipase family protein [Nocardioides mesophilus]